ncbi:MAG: hypothetical protein AAFR69_02395, partial [Pseudomonadota bacterium]
MPFKKYNDFNYLSGICGSDRQNLPGKIRRPNTLLTLFGSDGTDSHSALRVFLPWPKIAVPLAAWP